MAKATQTTTTAKKTIITIKPKTTSSKTSGTGKKRCPSCGKYM